MAIHMTEHPAETLFRHGEQSLWSTHEIHTTDWSDLLSAPKGSIARTNKGHYEKLSGPTGPLRAPSFRLLGGNGGFVSEEQLWRPLGAGSTIEMSELIALNPELLSDIEVLAALGPVK